MDSQNDYHSPIAFRDPDGKWSNEPNIYDADLSTYTNTTSAFWFPALPKTGYLYLNLSSPIYLNEIDLHMNFTINSYMTLDVQYSNGTWETVATWIGNPPFGTVKWQNRTLSQEYYTRQVRLRTWLQIAGAEDDRLHEIYLVDEAPFLWRMIGLAFMPLAVAVSLTRRWKKEGRLRA